MMESELWGNITVVASGIGTLAIFSFLIKENPFYRFFEHIFIGVAAGYLPIFTIKDFLWPQVLSKMFGYGVAVFPDGTAVEEYNPLYLLYIVPMAFGLLYYFIYSRKYGWLAKLVIGFTLGIGAGLTFKGFFAEMIPQLLSSFKPLFVISDGRFNLGQSVNNIIFVLTLLSVMYYFFFSFRRESRVAEGFSTTGRYLMMICFGAFFGSTVMARMALLVERVQFLLVDWVSSVGALF